MSYAASEQASDLASGGRQPADNPARQTRLRRELLAWGVHLYTALGLVAAAGIAVCIVRGGPADFRAAFILMLIAVLIDATDGLLARIARVKEILPRFDGRRLDDITDFLTYVFLPLLLIWRAEILPPGQAWWLVVPLLASAYGFCHVWAKTNDGFFLGFPSYWNLVAFYLYVLRLPGWVSLSVLLLLAVLVFVPSRYLYPSQRGMLNALTNLLGVPWVLLLGWILWRLPSEGSPTNQQIEGATLWLALLSLYFPIYYLLISWGISVKLWLQGR